MDAPEALAAVPSTTPVQEDSTTTMNAQRSLGTISIVDAEGSYGKSSASDYEGDPIDFDTTIIGESNSDYSVRIFDQLPARDLWFRKVCDNPPDDHCTLNNERSPWGGSISFSNLQ